MSFVFRQDGVNSLAIGVTQVASSVNSGLTSVQKASEDIAGYGEWQGNKATAVKDYMACEHGAILASLSLLLKDLYDQAMLYQKGCHGLDGDEHAVIPETELDDLKTRLDQMNPVFNALSAEAEGIVRSVSHIGTITYHGIDALSGQFSTLIAKLDTLCGDIDENETEYQNRFEAERNMISSLRAMLAEARGTNLESFSKDVLAQSEAYRNLANAYMALYEVVQNNAPLVEQAEIEFEKTYKILEAEYQERVEAAKKAKFWVGVGTAVLSAVILTATGGAGVVVVGAICGAANAVVGSIYDQKIGTVGCPGTVNGWEVAGAGLFGAVVGGATGYVSSCFSGATAGLSGSWGKVALKVTLDGAKNTINGSISRAGNACFDSIKAGEPVVNVIDNTLSSALDPKQMIGDFAGGCAGSAFSEGIGYLSGKVEGKLFSAGPKAAAYENSIQVTKAQSPLLRQAYKITSETATETGKGVVTRFTKELTQTGDVKSAWKKASDKEAVLSDASTTFASRTASTVTADTKTHLVTRMQKAQQKIDSVQERVDEETAFANNGGNKGKGNVEACEKYGSQRTKQGMPDFKGTEHCAAETTVEQVVADPGSLKDPKQASRQQDYKNAYNQMVAEHKIDPNEYIQKDSGAVIRRQTIEVNGVPTVVETEYTVHHVDYDVNTGQARFQLVEHSVHGKIHHNGGAEQAYKAYYEYGVGDHINEYNEAVDDANALLSSKPDADGNINETAMNVKAAKQAGKSGAKIISGHEEEEHSFYRMGCNPGFAFLS